MTYWLVSGLTGPRFAPLLRANLDRLQSAGLPCIAVVVETGDGVGATKVPDSMATRRVRQPQRGVVPFLEAAFWSLRCGAAPGDWFVRVDADDFYSAQYLRDVERSRVAGGEASAIPSHFLRTETGSLHFLRSRRARIGQPLTGALGGTLAGSIDVAAPWASGPGVPWGEDANWCAAMLEAGHPVEARGPEGYVFQRHEGHTHTYPARGEDLPHLWPVDAFELDPGHDADLAPDLEGRTPTTRDETKSARGFRHLREVALAQPLENKS